MNYGYPAGTPGNPGNLGGIGNPVSFAGGVSPSVRISGTGVPISGDVNLSGANVDNPTLAARARTQYDALMGSINANAKKVSDRLGGAYGANNILASRAALLGGATLALPSASEAMGEGRTLEAVTTVAGAAGTGAVVDRLTRGIKNPLARLGAQAAGAVVAPMIGQGAGQVAENVKAGITGKDPAGKTSRAATRAQMLEDAEVMAEVQRRFGAASLEPYTAQIKDLQQHALNVQYQAMRQNEPLINRLNNAQMVRQQALMNTQASNYAMLGTVATAGRLATGAQEQAGANLRTALTSNPYAGSVMQAPNISFG